MRIAPIYEGTNGIQAMDLVGRKLPMRMGGVVNDHLDAMRATLKELEAAGDRFAPIRANLEAGIEVLDTATKWIFEHGLSDPREALAGATPYLRIFGIVTGGWLSARLALGAKEELDAGADDTEYLEAKITTARFYATQLMPMAAGLLSSVTTGIGELFAVSPEGLASS
jgi:hypothetical protein